MVAQALFQTLILFILIVVGMVCYKTGIITDEHSKGMSSLLLYVVTPAVIIKSFMVDYSPETARGLLQAGLLCALAYAITINISRYIFRHSDKYDAEITRFMTIYPNNGYMGIPLAQGIFGDPGAFYMSVQVAVFNMFCFTQGVALFAKEGKKSFLPSIKDILSPPVMSIILGIIIFVVGINVPEFIRRPVDMVSQLQSPLAMFVAGVSICKTDLSQKEKYPVIAKATLARLLLFPFIYTTALSFIPVDPIIRLVAITGASCPAAAYGIIFSVTYDRDNSLAAQLFSVTTILSALTIPLMLMWADFLGVVA